MNKTKLIALIPALWTSSFDIILTIIHQSKEYWSGKLNTVNEVNPIGNFAMRNSIYGIFIISIFWLVLISILGYKLPRKYSRIFLLFVFIAHNYGASTWLIGHYGFWAFLAFTVFNSLLFYKVDDITSKQKMAK